MAELIGKHSTKLKAYLTFVPRGLENVASCAVKQALTSQSFACENVKVLAPEHETEEYIADLSDKLAKQQLKKRMKKERRTKWTESASSGDAKADHTSTFSSKQDEPDDDSDCPVVGTFQTASGEQISLGHHNKIPVLSKPGPVEGMLPLQFYTDAPPKVVAAVRGMGCGPLLALVASSHHRLNESSASSATIFGYEQSADEAKAASEEFVGQNDKTRYVSQFSEALSLWFDHATDVWFGNGGDFYGINVEDGGNKTKRDTLEDKRRGNMPLSFRVSCMRTYSKRYKHWKRQDIMTEFARCIVPSDELKLGNDKWKVDMKNHDFEVLAIIHETALTVGIVLRPYQLLKVKTYSAGSLPPDITPPYLTGFRQTEDIVRLKPSTASLLLHLAQVEDGDVVLDPCGGVGTIPVEASLSRASCVGIGGDVALKVQDFAVIAAKYLSSSQELTSRNGTAGASDFAAWDAALLPLRGGSVDCIISDIPFGSKCLSAKRLSRFLPLLLSECARVLRPATGRCLLLCGPGSYQSVVDSIETLKTPSGTGAFQLPCTSIFPTNIGGLVAWIVIVHRGEGVYIRDSDHNERVRTIASLNKQRERSQKNKRRRIQS